MAQQSILGRISQLARANINAIIDAAEDPEKMLDQMIRDYINSIRDAEEAVAQTIGNLRMMEEDQREATKAAADWGAKAAAAAGKAKELRAAGTTVDADRFENLARVALKRQITFEEHAADLTAPIAQQTDVVAKLKNGLNMMHVKLEELKAKRDELVGRAKVAEAQTKVVDALKSINITDPTSELGRFEDRIKREEARAAGMTEIAASSLDAQFDQVDDLAHDAEVDRRLAELNK
jgi:phage shock protein A